MYSTRFHKTFNTFYYLNVQMEMLLKRREGQSMLFTSTQQSYTPSGDLIPSWPGLMLCLFLKMVPHYQPFISTLVVSVNWFADYRDTSG